ncbi:MAG: lipocalin family protein [Bacteroidota bacterium]
MRTINKLLTISLFTLILGLFSCSTVKKIPTQNELIIGRWVVQSVNLGGQVVPASLLGGEIAFEFKSDGTAFFTTPDGQTENGRYAIQESKIVDPDSPYDEPVDIVSLSKQQLVISMMEEGELLKMTLVPDMSTASIN